MVLKIWFLKFNRHKVPAQWAGYFRCINQCQNRLQARRFYEIDNSRDLSHVINIQATEHADFYCVCVLYLILKKKVKDWNCILCELRWFSSIMMVAYLVIHVCCVLPWTWKWMHKWRSSNIVFIISKINLRCSCFHVLDFEWYFWLLHNDQLFLFPPLFVVVVVVVGVVAHFHRLYSISQFSKMIIDFYTAHFKCYINICSIARHFLWFKKKEKKHKLCAQMWNLADFTLRDWLWERKCIENISQLITPLCIAQSEETRLLSFFSLILKLISPKIMVSFPLSHSFFLSHLRANVRQPINWMPFIKQSARVYKLQCSWTSTNIKKRKKTVNNTLHTHRHTINFHLFVYGESWIVE